MKFKRFFPHSLISESRSRVGSLRLSDWFNRPVIVESGDNYDFLSRGMATQPEELTDINFDVEIKHFLFRRGMPFGGDLRAIDIQRNRDHGLASYNDFREFCGLRRANSWEDFLDLISQRVSFVEGIVYDVTLGMKIRNLLMFEEYCEKYTNFRLSFKNISK